MTLSLGSTLKADEIKEGDDVYFECHIKANPKEHRITWSHDVSKADERRGFVLVSIIHAETNELSEVVMDQSY